jgi:NADPH-dependent ferric siderophore reductase
MPRLITVREVATLSPRMRRVTFTGDDLATFVWSGPAAHVKLAFPEPGSDEPPVVTPDGPRPTTRTYTPRRFDAERGTLEIDFVLHGEGPGSSWAATARPGQRIVLMGPARGYAVDPEAAWYVLAGDEAALPAIETLLEAIPAAIPVRVVLEVAAADEERTLPSAERTEVRWLARGAAAPGALLAAELGQFAWPSGEGRFYVGCEAGAMREIRRIAVERSGLEKTRLTTRGYWRVGAMNHPDHDYGEN